MSSPAPIQLTFNITNATGSSGARKTNIVLLLTSSVTINWGDGTSSSGYLQNYGGQGLFTHTYASLGIYNVTISGTSATAIRRFGDYYGSYPCNYLRSVDSWGGFNITDLTGAFGIAEGTLIYVANIPSTVTNISGIFQGSVGLTSTLDISNWDVSNVIYFSWAFQNCDYNANIAGWNTRSASHMLSMFANNQNFNRPIGVWDTSNVNIFYQMFYRAGSFNQNLGNWSLKSMPDNGYAGQGFGNMFGDSAMNGTNISNTLYGWSQQARIPKNIRIYLNSNVYYYTALGVTGKNILSSSPYNWTINGNGIIPALGDAPVITSVVPGANNVTVSFTQSNPGTPAPTYYYSFNGTDLCGNGVSASPIVIPNLTISQTYTFYIIASSLAGNIVSVPTTGTPYAIGSAAIINSVTSGTNKLTVAFTDASGFYPAPTNYYSTNNGNTYPNTVPSNPFDITGLTTATTYYIKLKSSNSAGFQVSNTVSGMPNVVGTTPVINSVTSGTNKLTVAYTDATGFNPAHTLTYSTDNGNTYSNSVSSNPFDISGLTTATTYYIKLKASNSAGFQVSNTVSGNPFAIGTAPIIANVTPQSNSLRVDFTQSNVGNPAAIYYYSFNGTDICGNSVATSPITIQNLTLSQFYPVYIIATNSVGRIVSTVSSGKPLVTGSAPIINSVTPQPNSLLVSFTQLNLANPLPTYYYSFNGTDLCGNGMASSPITIPNLTLSQYYSVYIISSNSVGNVVSDVSYGKPLVTGNAPKINRVDASTNSLIVYFAQSNLGNPAPTYYYSFNQTDPCGNGVSSSPITIPDLSMAQYYPFYIISSNSQGNVVSDSSSGMPNVLSPRPFINRIDPSKNSLIVSFAGSTNSNPAPTYYYSFNGTDTSGVGVASSPITITDLSLAQYYPVYIIASNLTGKLVSDVSSAKPYIIGTKPSITRVDPSKNSLVVSFSGSANSNPAPTYYYSFNGTDASGVGVASSPITIPNLTKAENYVFYIIAANTPGTIVSDSSAGKPLVVGTAVTLNTPIPGPNNLTVSFTDASGFNPQHTNYYSINGGSYQYQVTTNPFVVSDLSSAGVYSISMKSENSVGYKISNTVSGEPLVVGTAALLNTPIPGPNNLTVSFIDASGFNPRHANYYSINGGSYQYQVTTNPFVVSDLSSAGVYSISMKSANSVGYKISNTVSGEPLVVGTAPYMNSITPDINKLVVDFNDATGFNPVHTTYYSLDGGFNYPYLVSSRPTFTIENLTTATVYYISLKSSNGVGDQISNTLSGEPFVTGTAAALNKPVSGTNSLSISFTDASGFNPKQTTYYSTDGGVTYPNANVVTASPLVLSGLLNRVYFIKFSSFNIAGNLVSNTVSGEPYYTGTAPILNTPTPGINSLTVSLTDASGFNPSQITEYTLDGGVTYTTIPSTLFTLSNLDHRVYTVQLKSSNVAGTLYSLTLSGEPYYTGTAPVLNSPTPGINSLTISLTDATGFNPKQITEYTLDGGVTYTTVPSNPFTLSSLEHRVYYIKLKSSNIAGNLVSLTLSGEPYYTGTTPVLNTLTPGTNSLTISLTDATGFNPKQTTQYTLDGGVTYTTIPSNSFTLSNLEHRVYTVQLKSFNIAGILYSLTLSGEPYYTGTSPILNTPTPGTNSLTVSLTDASGFNPKQITEYTLDGGVNYTAVPSNPFTLSSLEHRVYYIKLKSSNIAGILYSLTLSGEPYYTGTSPILNTPTPGTNSLTVSFTDASGFNPKQITEYTLDGGSNYTTVTSNPFTLSNLEHRVYYIKLKSSNIAGNLVSLTLSGEPYYTGTAPILNVPVSGIDSLTISLTDATGFYPQQITEYTLDGGVTYTTIPSNPFTLSNLERRIYYIKLKSSNIAGALYSLTLSGEPYYTGTSPILNTPTPGTNSLTVSFTDATGFYPQHTTQYTLDGGNTYTTVPSNPFTLLNLFKRVYYIKLKSFNVVGNLFSSTLSGEPFYTGTAATPRTPVPGINRLTIPFTDSYGFNPKATSYYLYSKDGGATYSTPIILPQSSPLVLTGLSNQTHFFKFKSSNSAGEVYSNEVFGTPYFLGTDPYINKVTSAKNSLIVDFSGSVGGNPEPTTYYSLDDGLTYENTPVTSSPFTINLPATETVVYYIKLNATNAAGVLYSNTVSGQPYFVGSNPIITKVDPSKNSLIVRFTQSSLGNPAPTYYYSFNGVDTSGQGVSSSPITIPNLFISKYYIVYIISSNEDGNVVSLSASGQPLVVGSAPIINTVTSAPNSLIVDFSQNNPGNPAPTYYYSFDGSYIDFSQNSVTSSPITIPNLTIAQFYTFHIVSINPIGRAVSLSASGQPYVLGSAPTIIETSNTLNGDVVLNGLVVIFEESSGGNPQPDTHYYSLNGGSFIDSGYATSPMVISGLNQPSPYFINITAHNLMGNTLVSNSIVGTPYITANPPTIYDIESGINRMSVSFMPAYNGYPEIITYFYSIDGENYIDAETTTSPILIDGLTKYGPYNVTLIGSSLAGYTQPSNSFVGKAHVVGDGPIITNIEENYNGLVITFKNPSAYPAPNYYYYSIDDINYVPSYQTDSTPLSLINLTSGTSYNISLYSVNYVGNSPISVFNALTLSSSGFFAKIINPSYNRKAPIYIGPQPKSSASSNGSTNLTAVSTRGKYSYYVSGTAGSRR